MEKGAPEAKALLERVMEVCGLDRDQLADRLGKKRRTIDGVLRGELALTEDTERHLRDLIMLAVYESGAQKLKKGLPAPPKVETHRVRDEDEGSYGNKVSAPVSSRVTPLARGRLGHVPLIGWAQAFDASSLVDYVDVVHWDTFVPSDIRDPKAIAVTIRGDSMEPQFREGDIAILACSKEPQSGNLIVGRLRKEGAVFKKFQVIDLKKGVYRLTSYNPHYAPIERGRGDFLWIYPVYSVTKKYL